MSTGRWHCPICGRFRCGPLFHRRCQAERTQLTGLVLEAIHKQQEAESEEFTNAIAGVQNSWLVAQRGVGSSELLEQIYKAVVDTWYLKADTADFAFYQSYLAHFQRRAAIRLEQPYERHRRLQLLHHLQQQQSPIPDCYLMPAPPGTRPYVKAVAQTSKSWQVEIRDVNYSGALVPMRNRICSGWRDFHTARSPGASKPYPRRVRLCLGQLYSTCAWVQPLVLDAAGLYHGRSPDYKYLRWQNMQLCAWGQLFRGWLRLSGDNQFLKVRVPRADREWLYATSHSLMERNQTSRLPEQMY